MKSIKFFRWFLSSILLVIFGGLTTSTLAGDSGSEEGSAMEQLEQAAEDGQEAVEAPTDEEAHEEASETFDTPHDSDGD